MKKLLFISFFGLNYLSYLYAMEHDSTIERGIDAIFTEKSAINNDESFNAKVIRQLPPEMQYKICKRIIRKFPQVFSPLLVCKKILQGHKGWVNSAKFNSQGNQIVTSSNDSSAKIWDVETGQCVRTIYTAGWLRWKEFAEFNPDDSKIVTTEPLRKTATIYDVTTGQILRTFPHSNFVQLASFDLSGSKLVTVAESAAYLWDTTSQAAPLYLSSHTSKINSAKFNHAGTLLVTASDDGSIKIWNAINGLLHQTHREPCLRWHGQVFIYDAEFNAADTQIVTASDNKIARIFDGAERRWVQTLKGHSDTVNSAKFNGSDTWAVTASNDGTVKIWDPSSGWCLHTLKIHEYSLWTSKGLLAEFNPVNTQIVTTEVSNRTVKIWNILNSFQYIKKEYVFDQTLFLLLLHAKHQEGNPLYLDQLDDRLSEEEAKGILNTFDEPFKKILMEKYDLHEYKPSLLFRLLSATSIK